MAGSDPLHLVRDQAQQRMHALKRLMPKVEMSIREASPRPTIVDGAVELSCQMIIMGTRGRREIGTPTLGQRG